jgi:hypothetical protein
VFNGSDRPHQRRFTVWTAKLLVKVNQTFGKGLPIEDKDSTGIIRNIYPVIAVRQYNSLVKLFLAKPNR